MNEIYISAVTGLTVSLQLYSSGVPYGLPFSAAEIGTTGEYLAIVPPGTAFGYYLVVADIGDDAKIASGDLYWDGEQEITPIMYEELRRLQGHKLSEPLEITKTSRSAGNLTLIITGDGENNTTVTRAP